MTIPAEWLPLLVAVLGGGGIGTLITALFSARSSVYKNLHDLVDQLQEDRVSDRAAISSLSTQVTTVITELHLEREYSSALYIWGLNGAPPPPPLRHGASPQP